MKKIIKNKVYDTNTARKIGVWESGEPGAFVYVSETLFRKRTGEFFLLGEGGAASVYAETDGSNRRGGSEILPLSYSAAKEWAAEHLKAEEYEAAFGEVTEGDDGKQVVTLSVPTGAWERIKRAASISGKSISAYVLEKCEA